MSQSQLDLFDLSAQNKILNANLKANQASKNLCTNVLID
jgi:hypothetical protein